MRHAGGSRVYAEAGIDKAWLHELFSPALGDWLARSPEGFSWELADGLLIATLDEHRTGEAELSARR